MRFLCTSLSILCCYAFVAFGSPQKSTKVGYSILLEQALKVEGPDVVASVLEVPFGPGDQGLPPHSHPGPVVGFVSEGEVLFQVEGGPLEILPTGAAFYEKDGAIHMWGANASNSTSAKIVVTIFGRPGQPLLTIVPNKTRDDFATALKKAVRRDNISQHKTKDIKH